MMCLMLRCFTGEALGSLLASFRDKWKNVATRTYEVLVDYGF